MKHGGEALVSPYFQYFQIYSYGTYQGQSGAIKGKEKCTPLHLAEVAIKKRAFRSPSTRIADVLTFK